MKSASLSLSDIRSAAAALDGRIVATPTLRLNSSRLAAALPEGARVHMKMELFQQAGSFKARGVLLGIDALSLEERQAGVTAVSAGNHAIATAWGAREAGLSAKVVMMKAADPVRVQAVKALGAELILADNVSEAFETVDRLVADEGRTMLHPFESRHMTLGAATCGLELAEAAGELDYAIVPVGGGGLLSGMAPAIRLARPDCTVIGVEPFGADSMYRSFEKGEAVRLETVDTIADSLGAPMALPQSFALAKAYVSEIVRIEDDAMRRAMRLLYDALKIAAEPACAATTAAICGPLRERLAGKRVGIIACGSNIGLQKFSALTDE